MTTESLRAALNRAFQLGQTYWQQADSESYKQNAKSDVTLDAFRALVSETCAALAQPSTEPFGYVVEHTHGLTEFVKSHPYLDTAVSCTPVYAAPPSTERAPLHGYELAKVVADAGAPELNSISGSAVLSLIRAIERAHGVL